MVVSKTSVFIEHTFIPTTIPALVKSKSSLFNQFGVPAKRLGRLLVPYRDSKKKYAENNISDSLNISSQWNDFLNG